MVVLPVRPMPRQQNAGWGEGLQVAQVSHILHVAQEGLDMVSGDALGGQAVQQVASSLLQQVARTVVQVPAESMCT